MFKKSLSVLLALMICFCAVVITPFTALSENASEIIEETFADEGIEEITNDITSETENELQDNGDDKSKDSVVSLAGEVFNGKKTDLASTGAEQTYGDFKYTVSGTNATITGYAGNGGAVKIKSSMNGYTVTEINLKAFANCTGITSVEIPDSVSTIGYAAFYGCTGMTSLKIGSGVTTMNDKFGYTVSGAFQGCTSLKSVTIAYGTTVIGNDAFKDCTGLTSINIPDSIGSIGDNAFRNCKALQGIKIGNTVKTIGSCAFEDCSAMTSLALGPSVNEIGLKAFANCTGITSVEIPDSVTTIGYAAFLGCTGMTSLKIGSIKSGVTKMDSKFGYTESGAFQNCTSLETVTIAYGTTVIGDDAFKGCTVLTSINIPDSIGSIGNNAFTNCKALQGIKIGNTVKTIGSCAFEDCSAMTSLTLGPSVNEIGLKAFAKCTGITSVEIPDSVTTIGYAAFYGCTGITSLKIGSIKSGVTKMDSKFGYTESGAFQNCTSLETVTIAYGTTVIGDDAFKGCTNLIRIDVPASVTSIGDVNSDNDNLVENRVFKNHAYTIHMYGDNNSFAHRYALANADNNIVWHEFNYPVLPTDLILSSYNETIELGKTLQLYATVKPDDATDKSVKWWSSDDSIATVSDTGLVTAKGSRLTNSTAKIYAKTSNGITKYCTVKVVVYPTGITLSTENLSLCVDESETLSVEFDPSYTNVRNINWTCSNSKIATVSDDGEVTGLTEGITTVTATTENGIARACLVEVCKKTYAQTHGWCLANDGRSFGYHDGKIPKIPRESYRSAYGISIPSLIYTELDRIGGGGGYCFGLSFLSLGQYYGKIDLKPYFSHTGESLYDFGYECLYRDSSSKEYFSLQGNDEAIALIERAMVLQDHPWFGTCQIFKSDSDYSELLEFLRSNNAKPILVNVLGSNCSGHSLVITTDYKPVSLGNNWYKIPVYDSNAPANSKLLTNPSGYYKREKKSYLKINTETSRWEYYCDDQFQFGNSYRSLSGGGLYSAFKSIWYYDVSKLSSAFFSGKIDMPKGAVNVKIAGQNIRVFNKENKIVFELKNGSCVTLDNNYALSFVTNGTDENGTPNYLLSVDDRDELFFESDDAEVLALSSDYIYLTELNGSFTADISFDTGKISAEGINNSGEVLIAVCENATDRCIKTTAQLSKNGYSMVQINDSSINVISSDNSLVIEGDGADTNEIESIVPGDVNSDKEVDMKDIVLLQQYLNDWDVAINEIASDVNSDGIITMKDIVLLQQHLNDWDVVLK